VVTPNGLITNLYGPLEGSRHDSFLLQQSGLLPRLQIKFRRNGAPPFCLYGDPAYGIQEELLAPYKNHNKTPDQEAFNKAMSVVRQSVEWEFGRLVQNFAFLDFKKNLKLYLQPVGKYYKVGVILNNCLTCLNGSETSEYFNVEPPVMENYLRNSEI